MRCGGSPQCVNKSTDVADSAWQGSFKLACMAEDCAATTVTQVIQQGFFSQMPIGQQVPLPQA